MKRTSVLPPIALVAALAACSRNEPPLPAEPGATEPASVSTSSPPQAQAREARVKRIVAQWAQLEPERNPLSRPPQTG
jgi:hypothetical protein